VAVNVRALHHCHALPHDQTVGVPARSLAGGGGFWVHGRKAKSNWRCRSCALRGCVQERGWKSKMRNIPVGWVRSGLEASEAKTDYGGVAKSWRIEPRVRSMSNPGPVILRPSARLNVIWSQTPVPTTRFCYLGLLGTLKKNRSSYATIH
jgi:hypothetical protein